MKNLLSLSKALQMEPHLNCNHKLPADEIQKITLAQNQDVCIQTNAHGSPYCTGTFEPLVNDRQAKFTSFSKESSPTFQCMKVVSMTNNVDASLQ
mgnify:CR=1 FL=1